MPGPALTLAALAALVVSPDCGGVDVRAPEGELMARRLVAKAQQESGIRGTDLVHPFAIKDEVTGQSHYPRTREAAVALVADLHGRQGHKLGLGLMMITGADNWAADGITAETAFDDCANVRAGAAHYRRDLDAALAAMNAASSRYNSGRLDGAPAYVRAVVARQARLPADLFAPAPSGAASPALVPDAPKPVGSDAYARAREAGADAYVRASAGR